MTTKQTSASSYKSAKSAVQTTNTQRWGFNDLQRRQDDLCQFVKSNCLPSITSGNSASHSLTLMQEISFIPLPLHSH